MIEPEDEDIIVVGDPSESLQQMLAEYKLPKDLIIGIEQVNYLSTSFYELG